MRKEFDNLHSPLKQKINSIDYAHICSKFSKSNDLKHKSNTAVQRKNFYNLVLPRTQRKSSTIFWSMSYQTAKKSLLTKDLNSSIRYKKLNYADYLVHFELFWDICDLDILSNEEFHFVKAKTKEAALSCYRSYNNNVPQSLYKKEFIALQNLSKNKELIIQKSG